ncbi:MAG: hypothetical protein Q4E63_00950 [Prevotellaceae bacterium]|nr:hypothetical protein [Prevotellaceae bacterium]
MNIEEAKSVLNTLSKEFDSHEFIRKYIQDFTVSYGQLLIERKQVELAHGAIGIFLSQHSDELGINCTGKHKSIDIFNNESSCATWSKL